jgi:hypothetical protein
VNSRPEKLEIATLIKVNSACFKKNPNFPRYIAPDFLQYLCERLEMNSQ